MASRQGYATRFNHSVRQRKERKKFDGEEPVHVCKMSFTEAFFGSE